MLFLVTGCIAAFINAVAYISHGLLRDVYDSKYNSLHEE